MAVGVQNQEPIQEGAPPVAEPAPANAPAVPKGQSRPNGQQRGKQARQNRSPKDESFMKRAQRMARAQTRETMQRVAGALGLEEFDEKSFEAKLKELEQAKRDGMSVIQRTDAKAKEYEQQVQQLRQENQRLKKDAQKTRGLKERLEQQRQSLETEASLKLAAVKAGIDDSEYALHLVERHLSENGSDGFEPETFFEGLKQSSKHKHLFRPEEVPAGPRAGMPPQHERQPPPAAPAGTPPKNEDDVEKLDKRAFNQRTRERYAFSPPM